MTNHLFQLFLAFGCYNNDNCVDPTYTALKINKNFEKLKKLPCHKV